MLSFGTVCIVLALLLDSASYWRQSVKILRTKTSRDVSSTSYIYKILKAILAGMGLVYYANYVGLVMECFMLLVYIASFYIIYKYKPKGWKLW